MTVEEISSRLDEELQRRIGGIIVDEYTKSLYLTKAQSVFVTEVLRNYEYGDEIRHILGKLLKSEKEASFSPGTQGSHTVVLQSDIKAIVYESVDDSKPVIPLDWNDIHYTLKNPFREPDDSIAYRVTENNKAYIFSKPAPISYEYVYCEIPKPVVLENLPPGLEIQNVTTETESVLPYDSILTVITLAADLIYKDTMKFANTGQAPEKQVQKE